MSDPKVYLEKISAFSSILRGQGLAVSPREIEDACRILCLIGFEDREQVRTALRALYAKNQKEQEAFDRVFDGFFISEEQMIRQAMEQSQRQAEMEEQRRLADRDLESLDFTEAQRDAYASLAEEQKKKLREIKEKYKDGTDRSPDLYNNFIHSVFAKAILEQQMLLESAGSGCDSMDPELGLMYRDISEFSDQEMPKAISIIQTISQQINGELSNKRKTRAHGGKLDFRGTIRKGLETGGSLYKLKYRKKRARKKHLVLLCDVSGSMVQFSEFALRFIQSLNRVSESSRVFLFSETLFEADVFSLQNMDLFRDYVRSTGIYGKGTDLGTALHALSAMSPSPLNTSSTLLILSDTKTIDQPRAIAELKEAIRQCGRVIWLNPIPKGKWQYIRSVQTMEQICPMVSCSTLQALADACRRLTL